MTSQNPSFNAPLKRRGRRRKALPRLPESVVQAAIDQFIETRGVTRCPTACAARTRGMPDEADREILRARAALFERMHEEKHPAHSPG